MSPQTVAGWATFGTVTGWVLRNFWQSRGEVMGVVAETNMPGAEGDESAEPASTESSAGSAPVSAPAPADFGMAFA